MEAVNSVGHVHSHLHYRS